MAKELPFFKFEPAEYLTKDISFCSLQAQGLFINICSYYWQRGCKLNKKQILKRFNYPDILNELIEEDIITFSSSENISIKFLLNQFKDIEDKKTTDSEKGKIGNLKRWHEDIYNRYMSNEISLKEALAIAKTSGGDTLAIAKTSQIREDKIILDNNNININNHETFKNECLNSQIWQEQVAMTIKTHIDNIPLGLKRFNEHLITTGENKMYLKDYKSHFMNWFRIIYDKEIKKK